MLQKLSRYFKRVDIFSAYPKNVLGIPSGFLHIDYAVSCLVYGCSISEYYLYQFYKLAFFERREFLTLRSWNKLLKTNPEKSIKIIENKENFLNGFNEFLSRDWLSPRVHGSMEQCIEFCKKHTKCILKPIDECGGHGIEIIDITPDDAEKLCMKLSGENLVAEELIQQNFNMAKLHPYSVNTIRMMTINCKIVGATLRIGAAGRNVDNASSGGCFASVELQSGIVTTCGYDFKGKRYLTHPTTGVCIPGFQIPFWAEACDMVKQAAKKASHTPIIGWDIAISVNGPVLVEGNVKPGIRLMQVAEKKGKRKCYCNAMRNI